MIRYAITMQTSITQTLKKSWARLLNSSPVNLPLLSAGEQTRGSWAREIESYDQVPDVYTGFFNKLPGEMNSFPYSVVTPTYKGFFKRQDEKLICNLDHRICVLEASKNQLKSTCYALKDIDCIETGTVLLRSWLRIHGLMVDGEPSSSTLIFNSVTGYMFDPFIQMVRGQKAASGQRADDQELRVFDSLADVDFKLMNYSKRSILPGERVLCFVMQPEISKWRSGIFVFPFSGRLTKAHITILTDRELIMIKDAETSGWRQDNRYGGTWSYIPIIHIRSASIDEEAGGLLTLSIKLSAGDTIVNRYTISNERAVEELTYQLEKMISTPPIYK